MEKEYPIKISPEILELLGPSLYTNIYYVLAEVEIKFEEKRKCR